MVQPFKMGQNLRIAAQGEKAFSLVELAVVLAVIGLIAGGVMGTSAYLNTARKTTVINEGKYYLNALKKFQVKYGGSLPGDMGNASDVWGGATNGNGNGQIELGTEAFGAFKHLQLEGLINGKFTGVGGPGGPINAVIGTNVPTLSMQGVTGWFITPSADGYITGSGAYYDGTYGTILVLGKETATMPWGAFLPPVDALQLDTKFDDGQADKGWIRSRKDYSNCVSGTTYQASNTADSCVLILSGN